jgi:hypothetical protein
MKINFPILGGIVENIHGIPISTVMRITHRQWCGPMTLKGFCSEDCSDPGGSCAAHLQLAFKLDGARNPAALLTWSLKNQLASVQEETHVHEFVALKDIFGRTKASSDDILGDLAKRFI